MTAGCDAATVRWLPGWTLRLAVAVLGLGAVALVSTHDVRYFAVVPLLALAGLATWVPASVAPAMLIGGVALFAMLVGGPPLRWEVLVLIPVLHLLHLASALAGLLPRAARVHPAALRAPAIRFACTQLAVFAGIGVLALVRADGPSVLVDVAALLAVLAGLLGVLWLLRGRG